MLEITEAALKTVKDYMFERKINTPIRVSVMLGSCFGPKLKICADEERKNDHVVDYDEVKFVVDKGLLTSCGSILIDHRESHSNCYCSGGCGGYRISGEKKFQLSDRCRLDKCSDVCRCDIVNDDNSPTRVIQRSSSGSPPKPHHPKPQ